MSGDLIRHHGSARMSLHLRIFTARTAAKRFLASFQKRRASMLAKASRRAFVLMSGSSVSIVLAGQQISTGGPQPCRELSPTPERSV